MVQPVDSLGSGTVAVPVLAGAFVRSLYRLGIRHHTVGSGNNLAVDLVHIAGSDHTALRRVAVVAEVGTVDSFDNSGQDFLHNSLDLSLEVVDRRTLLAGILPDSGILGLGCSFVGRTEGSRLGLEVDSHSCLYDIEVRLLCLGNYEACLIGRS